MLTLTLRPTDARTTIDGVGVRLWRGTTAAGNPVDAYVYRLAAGGSEATARELEAALEVAPLPQGVALIDLVLERPLAELAALRARVAELEAEVRAAGKGGRS